MAIANLPPEVVSDKMQTITIKLIALSNALHSAGMGVNGENNELADTLIGFAMIIDDQAKKIDELATALISKVVAAA